MPFGSFGVPWLYCNEKFSGYFGLKYVNSNWDHLTSVLTNNIGVMKLLFIYQTKLKTYNLKLIALPLIINAFFFYKKLLEPLDRSNLIHNFFVDAYSDRNNYTTYNRLALLLKYLENETDYYPWRTVHKHLNDILDILEYKQPFEEVSRFFRKLIQKNSLKDTLWSSGGNHIDE